LDPPIEFPLRLDIELELEVPELLSENPKKYRGKVKHFEDAGLQLLELPL
jgi:hypothetical protein